VVRQSIAFFLFAGAALAACSSSGGDGPSGPACVTPMSLECKPLYDPPSYQNIFQQTFQKSCAVGVGTCHTSDGAKGGLVFADANTAYALLLGQQGGRQRVVPGNPGCSLLMERLQSTDPTFRMPLGDQPLLPAEVCAITQWIANGAKP